MLHTLSLALSLAAAQHAAPALLPSVVSLDTKNHTAVLPLYRGTFHGTSVWYILTDSSDAAVAKRDRIVYSPTLSALGSAAVERATWKNGSVAFSGVPDFSPTRTYVPSAMGFPPTSATPGSVGDALYSPFVAVEGLAGVFNAPVIATGDGPFDVATHTNTEDRVLAIDTAKRTVTIALARGFFADKPVYYLSTEASVAAAAAVERATFVPRLAMASLDATIPIGVLLNGPRGDQTHGQGLAYLSLDTPLGDDASARNIGMIGSPFNLLSNVPQPGASAANAGYSPLWSVHLVKSGSARITSFSALPADAAMAGILVNCPVVAFGDNSY